MSNDNTERRQLYLPKVLNDWFIKESDNTSIKINTLMVEALVEYAENHSKKTRKKKSDFEKDVRKITLALLKEKGLL
jgi:protein involved in sex pheromone biosynthesis